MQDFKNSVAIGFAGPSRNGGADCTYAMSDAERSL